MGSSLNNPSPTVAVQMFVPHTACYSSAGVGDAYGIQTAGGAQTLIYTQVRIPTSWDGKQLKFAVVWEEANAEAAKNVYWKVGYSAVTDGEAWITGGTTGDTSTDCVDGTANSAGATHISPFSTTTAKTFAAGDIMMVKVERDGASGTDTATQTQNFLGVIIEAA